MYTQILSSSKHLLVSMWFREVLGDDVRLGGDRPGDTWSRDKKDSMADQGCQVSGNCKCRSLNVSTFLILYKVSGSRAMRIPWIYCCCCHGYVVKLNQVDVPVSISSFELI